MGIDLRAELKELFEIDEGGVARWILIRHFTNEHSEYYNEVTKEGVGGPAFKFVDTLVQAYSTIVMQPVRGPAEGLAIRPVAPIEESMYKFYLEHDVTVDENDEIFDLDYEKSDRPTVVYTGAEVDKVNGKVRPIERFKIRKVEPYRCDEGRTEFKIAYGDKTIYR